MASISTEVGKRGTRWRVLLVVKEGGIQRRHTIRLGKINKRIAETAKRMIESLEAAKSTGHSLDSETAAWVADKGKTLFDLLVEIYMTYSFYKESLLSVTRKGKAGAEEIQQMMVNYRNHPLKFINNIKVTSMKDYLTLEEKNLETGTVTPIHLPSSNVLQFILEDGSVISIRPSGTEPKIKYYFGVRAPLKQRSDFDHINSFLDDKIEGIIHSMKLR